MFVYSYGVRRSLMPREFRFVYSYRIRYSLMPNEFRFVHSYRIRYSLMPNESLFVHSYQIRYSLMIAPYFIAQSEKVVEPFSVMKAVSPLFQKTKDSSGFA